MLLALPAQWDLLELPEQPGLLVQWDLPVQPELPEQLGLPDLLELLELPEQLLRQYMHNTEIAVTMRLSTILKTIKQPL